LPQKQATNSKRRLAHPDQAVLLRHLEPRERVLYLSELGPLEGGQILFECDAALREELLASLGEKRLASMLSLLSDDQGVELLEALSETRRAKVLSRMRPSRAARARLQLSYPLDSAGRIMTGDLMKVRPLTTVGAALATLRRRGASRKISYVYVTDRGGKLLGTLSVWMLLRSRDKDRVARVMTAGPVAVDASLDQEEVAKVFKKYDLLSLPVIDGDEVLLGHITHDDVLDVMQEESTEDLMRMVGTDEQELSEPSLLTSLRLRWPWLALAFIGELVAGWIIINDSGQLLREYVVLASFIPAIMAMGGNVGGQVATIVVRGLQTEFFSGRSIFQTVRREVWLALIF